MGDYAVDLLDAAGGWHSLAQVKGNYQRRCVHTLSAPMIDVAAVRVNVTPTNEFRYPNPNAHINEIRVYGPEGLLPFPDAPAGWDGDLRGKSEAHALESIV